MEKTNNSLFNVPLKIKSLKIELDPNFTGKEELSKLKKGTLGDLLSEGYNQKNVSSLKLKIVNVLNVRRYSTKVKNIYFDVTKLDEEMVFVGYSIVKEFKEIGEKEMWEKFNKFKGENKKKKRMEIASKIVVVNAFKSKKKKFLHIDIPEDTWKCYVEKEGLDLPKKEVDYSKSKQEVLKSLGHTLLTKEDVKDMVVEDIKDEKAW
jgi:hypothetical protein